MNSASLPRSTAYKLSNSHLDSHLSRSSAVRQEMYLLPWEVATWKQWSWLRTLWCTGLTSVSLPVTSTACMALGLESSDSWDRDVRIRELISDLHGTQRERGERLKSATA